MIVKTSSLYEFLARFDTETGQVSGFHVRMMDVIKDNGTVINSSVGIAQPVTPEGIAAMLDTSDLTILTEAFQEELDERANT